jgi:hypothetical protein
MDTAEKWCPFGGWVISRVSQDPQAEAARPRLVLDSGEDAQLPHLRLLAPAVGQVVFPVLAATNHQANRCYTSFPAGIV